ncbi:hypothetical protein ATCCBAA256_17700 [Mycobacterium montefiorense]|nr:hypothetical protein ATCCBAA256_17700 [Mycobacterium montefiorense]
MTTANTLANFDHPLGCPHRKACLLGGGAAGRGHAYPTPQPLNQWNSQFSLQGSNVMRHRWLRHIHRGSAFTH